ncbi:bifunctional hydroxymethylpyrimidine kinase/phosphomethylpyrimidine kinase [Desulfurispirillum indicum]|uniref:bifunctional hydroxymethylpyrimidine kinase/phosphomethylpyrimidine kinase n=1 Tax=Desulfurispirillum indicum TaxID=936456 RepID=UPI001CFA9D42|nr:bifunctional hydroxymethylpyrimidine kinase/phosphomethylpyrimidine kinase [Desulfurispirillum indicum]UCZ56853.1 bifunctional hydroxymethylpyrimidine kinase/phosphomethylpyrimidine kinase [Desulfurispirillum indicum]
MTIPCVLSIAGSDPSGGAGIQADLKVFSALETYGAAAITCLTVQNTIKVHDALMLDGVFVRAQVERVLEDIPINVIKTGMLGNGDIARHVGEAIEGRTIVCDPVMISKSGYALMNQDAMDAIMEHVVARATILTPNFHELLALAQADESADPLECGERIMQRFPRLQALLVKGGHIDEQATTVTDTLIMRHGGGFSHHSSTHPRIDTPNTHGTGCTLSSAIAAYLAKSDGNIVEAVQQGIAYVHRLITRAAQGSVGKGNGPLLHHVPR